MSGDFRVYAEGVIKKRKYVKGKALEIDVVDEDTGEVKKGLFYEKTRGNDYREITVDVGKFSKLYLSDIWRASALSLSGYRVLFFVLTRLMRNKNRFTMNVKTYVDVTGFNERSYFRGTKEMISLGMIRQSKQTKGIWYADVRFMMNGKRDSYVKTKGE